MELTLADSAAVGAAGEIFDRLFAEKVEEITGGKMTVYLYLNGELGNDMDLLSQMQAGYIDLVGCQIAPGGLLCPRDGHLRPAHGVCPV